MIISLEEFAVVGRKEELHDEYSKAIFSIGSDEYDILNSSLVTINTSCEEKDKLNLKISFDASFKGFCDRCLEDTEISIKCDGEYEFLLSETDKVDTEELLNEEIIQKWPMKVLCSEDCKGLCLKCGRNLNTGTCECDTFIPDPRMAAIKDIFESER